MEDNNKILEIVRNEIDKMSKVGSFTDRKVTDTPTDNLAMVNRRYVNLNGTTAARPISSVAILGQQYFSTTAGYPLFYNGTQWVSATGSVVGV